MQAPKANTPPWGIVRMTSADQAGSGGAPGPRLRVNAFAQIGQAAEPLCNDALRWQRLMGRTHLSIGVPTTPEGQPPSGGTAIPNRPTQV